MREVYYTHSLASNMDCWKKVEFYLDKTEGEVADYLDYGIKLHKYCEDYLNGNGEPDEFPYPHYEDAWKKIKPYLDSILPKIEAVELSLNRDDDAGDFRARGRLDALGSDGTLYDWKFVGQQWGGSRLAYYVKKQALLYLWMAEEYCMEEHGILPTRLEYSVVPKKGDIKLWVVEYDKALIERELIQWKNEMRMLDSYQAFDNFPANPALWRCRMCKYKNKCMFSATRFEKKPEPPPIDLSKFEGVLVEDEV